VTSIIVQVIDDDDVVVQETTTDLTDEDIVLDEWEWCWYPVPQPKSAVKIDLAMSTNATDKIRYVTTGSGTRKIGKVCVGTMIDLGRMQFKFDDGIIDYSINQEDWTGEQYLVEGRAVQELNGVAQTTLYDSDRIIRALIETRATYCVWDVSEDSGLSSLIYFGLLKDWRRRPTAKKDVLSDSIVEISFKLKGAA
jgi:hypothetical protein